VIINAHNFGTGDADADAYIAAVEAADGAGLAGKYRNAIGEFVKGAKSDGFWSAIKAACLLAGPATLSGALIPLVGSAPTNVNFVSGDYSQATGLVGNGSTKYLNANRNNNADPQNNVHQSVWVSTASANGVIVSHIGAGGGGDAGATHIISDRTVSDWVAFRNRSATFFSTTGGNSTGFIGHTRAASGSYTTRVSGANTARTNTSGTAFAGNSFVFARNIGSPNLYSSARLAWYSIGENLDLALLNARLTTYMAAIA
jgi:hypothetical protein